MTNLASMKDANACGSFFQGPCLAVWYHCSIVCWLSVSSTDQERKLKWDQNKTVGPERILPTVIRAWIPQEESGGEGLRERSGGAEGPCGSLARQQAITHPGEEALTAVEQALVLLRQRTNAPFQRPGKEMCKQRRRQAPAVVKGWILGHSLTLRTEHTANLR